MDCSSKSGNLEQNRDRVVIKTMLKPQFTDIRPAKSLIDAKNH